MRADPTLIDQLAALHGDAFGWAVSCSGGDPTAGEDALQEAYVKVVSGRARFGGRSSLKTWWFSVVRITALERGRGERRWQRMADAFHEWFSGLSAPPFNPATEDWTSTPGAERLAAALVLLPARQAEVLNLVFQHDLTLSEAAEVMHVSLGSARQHYNRAKKCLRRHLIISASDAICAHES